MFRLRASQVPPHLRKYFRVEKSRPKSLLLIPERYRIACTDQLGLIARSVIIWSKANSLPESVRDRVRRSHEDWVMLTREPRYFSAVDEIREEQSAGSVAHAERYSGRYTSGQVWTDDSRSRKSDLPLNPLGKLPGSVWTIPTQPLTVPPELGVDHFAAFPMEWPRRIIRGWSPAGVCTVCGEGRRPVTEGEYRKHRPSGGTTSRIERGNKIHDGGFGQWGTFGDNLRRDVTITGYACGCTDPTAPTRPATILDPFSGTGTTVLVAKMLGRTGIGVDMSSDYCRLAEWRTTDPGQMAAALEVERPETVSPDQLDLFSEAATT